MDEDIDGAEIWIEDGIFNVTFKKDTVLSFEYAKRLVHQRLKMSNNIDFPLYIDIRGILSVDGKTRKYLRSGEGTQNAMAAAIHVASPISKFLGNLFITVDKPDKPTKLFTNRDKAIKWLRKFH